MPLFGPGACDGSIVPVVRTYLELTDPAAILQPIRRRGGRLIGGPR